MRVAFCVPSLAGPTAPFIDALEKSAPLVTGAGWDDILIEERGCPYISGARATMLRKALDAKADVIVFLDYDLSWEPSDLLKLIETPGDVVAGTYRFKKDDEEYMGQLALDAAGKPMGENAGETETLVLRAERIPAGFLKITKEAVHRLIQAYPELCYGPAFAPSLDLFNHGAYEGVWWGEDYAFSRRWLAVGGDLWVIPDLSITHHSSDAAYPGNLHQFLMKQPGGAHAPPIDQGT